MADLNTYLLTDLRDNTRYYHENTSYSAVIAYLRKQSVNPASFWRSIPTLAWYIDVARL